MTAEAAKIGVEKVVMALVTRGAVPSGHLYADVMDVFDLETYLRLIENLKAKGLVRVSNHLVMWTGPK